MRRSGFTMIELIFVIVILGILAAVAIPKLMATRTDAKIAAVTQQVQSAIGEIPTYVTSQGKIDNIETMSQVIKAMHSQGKANVEDTNDSASNISHFGNDINVTMPTSQHSALIGTQDDSGNMEDCIEIDLNSTTMKVTRNANSNGTICDGVKARITDQDITIAGTGVNF